jgi:hypothetical protein
MEGVERDVTCDKARWSGRCWGGDFETECPWPEMPAFIDFHKLIARYMKSAGGSPTAGRELLSWGLKAGAQWNQITVSYGKWYCNTPVDKEVWGKTPRFSTSAGIDNLGADHENFSPSNDENSSRWPDTYSGFRIRAGD